MNKIIVVSGVISALLWGSITAMTFGLPENFCHALDRATFHKFTVEILRMTNGFYYDVSNNDMPTVAFLVIFAVLFILSFSLLCRSSNWKTDDRTLNRIVFFSILFRIILVPGELIHENDLYRYIWDGKTSVHKINPYKYAPVDVALYDDQTWETYDDETEDLDLKHKVFSKYDKWNLETLHELRGQNPAFYSRIGHWEVPSIYPPAAQVLFTIPVLINSYSLILMKSFFVLFDIASLFLIIGLLKHFKRDPCMVMVYGWSPLVLYEFANRGHYDPIPVFFTLLSLLLFVKKKEWGGTCVLAIATLSKFFSVVLFPILVRPFKKRYFLLFASVICIFYLPFIFWDETGVRGVFEGFVTYNEQWSYNASIFAIIKILLKKLDFGLSGGLLPAKIIAGGLYLIILTVLTVKKNKSDLDTMHKCFLAIALLFIINPVADPWYFCWAIPFLCLFPYRSWYLLSGLLMISYLNFHTDLAIVDQQYLGFPLIGWIIYVPFFLAVAIEALMRPMYIMGDHN